MKKTILAFAAIAVLAGCAHTHYAKDERYVQSGHDCIVKTSEWGVVARNNVDNSGRTVYPNTHCAEVIGKSAPVAKTVYSEPATVRTVKRVYLRSGCPGSYGAWC